MDFLDGDIVIIGGLRSPFGSLNGNLSSLKAHEIGSLVIKNLLQKFNVSSSVITKVICGQVFTANQGQNPCRQLAINSGLSNDVVCYSLNMLCGSGLKSVINAFLEIKCDSNHVIIAGGQESMSQMKSTPLIHSKTPHSCQIRQSNKYGDVTLVDIMLKDGLIDAFHNVHMIETAENVGRKYEVTREEVDKYTWDSINKYRNAYDLKLFDDEKCSITLKNGRVINEDEIIKRYSSIDELNTLKTVYNSQLMTVANCSSLNDGASFVILCEARRCFELGYEPLAKIISIGEIGNDPLEMGIAPIKSIQQALIKANLTMDDIDLFEINDAFAVTSIIVSRKLEIPLRKINVNSGALMLGHPLGASGCRCLIALIINLQRFIKSSNKRTAYGIVSLCIGGGMSVSMCIQVYNSN